MKIFAVGMNYALHRRELASALGQSAEAAEPVIFTKADSALVKGGKPFFLPDDLGRIDYETELVVRLSRLGKSIPERFAHRYWDAVTVGLDITARDLQRQLRAKGLPWEISKGFDGSAIIGEWREKSDSLEFRSTINGTLAQEGRAEEMTYSIDRLISYISRFFTIKTGDLLFTGTPAGVGPLAVGDHVEGFLCGEKVLDCHVR